MGLDKDEQIRILQNNVSELQMQLSLAYKRIKELVEEKHDQSPRKTAEGSSCRM